MLPLALKSIPWPWPDAVIVVNPTDVKSNCCPDSMVILPPPPIPLFVDIFICWESLDGARIVLIVEDFSIINPLLNVT